MQATINGVQHEVADATYEASYEECGLVCDYVVEDYGSEDDAPICRIIEIRADFGGMRQVVVPFGAISGARLRELELLCSDDVVESEAARAADLGKHRLMVSP